MSSRVTPRTRRGRAGTPLAAPQSGRREHRKHVTREELLSAGRALFGEKGLYESRIEDLSRRAGIAKGTLYGYFANKDELVEAVATSAYGELLGHAQRAAQLARNRAGVIGQIAEAHLDFFVENPDLMRVLHQVRGLLKFHRPETAPLRRVLARYLAGLAHVLSLHHPAPRAERRHHEESAALLFGAVSGIASVRAALGSPLPEKSLRRDSVRALVALVLAFEQAPSERRAVAASRLQGRSRPA